MGVRVSRSVSSLLDPGNDQFVKDRILLPQILQERENRLVPLSIVVKAYTKLHRSPAVSVGVLQHLCCIVHERTCSCKTGSSCCCLVFGALGGSKPFEESRAESISGMSRCSICTFSHDRFDQGYADAADDAASLLYLYIEGVSFCHVLQTTEGLLLFKASITSPPHLCFRRKIYDGSFHVHGILSVAARGWATDLDVDT